MFARERFRDRSRAYTRIKRGWKGGRMRSDLEIKDLLPRRNICDLTVIVPAYNEADSIADTVRSLQNQTLKPV